MSIYIIAADNINRQLVAVTDKRIGRGYFTRAGEMVKWEFDHDNAVKMSRINETVFATGAATEDYGHLFPNALKLFSHLPTPDIIEEAKKIDRKVDEPADKNFPYEPAVLFGLYDDRRPFLWCGEKDGTEKLQVVESGKYRVQICGGLDGTDDKVSGYLKTLLDKKLSWEKIIYNSLQYATSIDKVISPSYNIVKMSW